MWNPKTRKIISNFIEVANLQCFREDEACAINELMRERDSTLVRSYHRRLKSLETSKDRTDDRDEWLSGCIHNVNGKLREDTVKTF